MLMVANTEILRKQNRALILSCLRERGEAAHTDIAVWTGLSSATVSVITQELLDEKLIVKSQPGTSSGRGRPRILLKHNPGAAFVSVIRITSDEIECSLADYSGTLKDRFSVKRILSGTETSEFTRQFQDCIKRTLRRSEIDHDQLKMISVTSKGLVATGQPVLLWSPIFGDQRIDFSQLLPKNWNIPVRLSNETQFAAEALAYRQLAKARPVQHRYNAVLSLDHSIGLGITKYRPDGTISASAPSFGHMMHQADGPLCRCGNKGCIEAYAGFYGILRTAFDVPSDTIPAKFVPLEEVDKLADNARRGDLKAQYAFRIAGETLGIGISRLMSVYGIMPLTISGRGLKYFDLMREGFEEPLNQNLNVRLEKMPAIEFHSGQTSLIYEGNIANCLKQLDANILSANAA